MKKRIYEMALDDLGVLGYKAVSYVDDPAIQAGFIHLSKQAVKLASDEERRMVYGPVLIPDQEIYRVDPKTKEEYFIKFPRKVVEEIAYRMMEQGKQGEHTEMHAKLVGDCCVVEVWLKHSDVDKSVSLGLGTFPDGTLFFGDRVKNDDIWAKVKNGTYKGFSIEAICESIELSAAKKWEEEFFSEVNELIKLHA